jgi:succinate dehydrogenase flavin-adding protein (antitoxin of CptAB toxin-antitoxin module)
MDRAEVRDAEIDNAYMQNRLDYQAKQGQLEGDYNNRVTNVAKYN